MEITLIKFRNSDKNYFFSIPDHITLSLADLVVVETTIGLEIGEVVGFKEESDDNTLEALKPVLRVASDKDINNYKNNMEDAIEALECTKKLVKNLKLNMQLLNAEYTLDKSRLTIYFKAEERVDFRDLVRDLSAKYKARIELRQLGPRDIAKMVGGLGPCGLLLCCSSFIGEFEPVSINMAKNQNLSLNPANISGICGRLLCCLKYEDEVYQELKELMPDLFETVKTFKGSAKVMEINYIKNEVKVKYRDEEHSPEWINYRELK